MSFRESLYYFFLIVKERQPIQGAMPCNVTDWLNRQCKTLCFHLQQNAAH